MVVLCADRHVGVRIVDRSTALVWVGHQGTPEVLRYADARVAAACRLREAGVRPMEAVNHEDMTGRAGVCEGRTAMALASDPPELKVAQVVRDASGGAAA